MHWKEGHGATKKSIYSAKKDLANNDAGLSRVVLSDRKQEVARRERYVCGPLIQDRDRAATFHKL
jgi:hypothetical protein